MKIKILFILVLTISMNLKAGENKKVLIYTFVGEGYVHDNVSTSAKAIEKLGIEHGFATHVSDTPTVFHEASLREYDAVVFCNTNQQAFLTNEQRLAFKRYIQAGGAFVGIHGASTSESHWPWFVSMVGGKFVRHPPFQEYKLKLIDREHISSSFLPETWEWEDECYFMDYLNPAMNVLLAADLSTVEDNKKTEYPGTTFGNLFPAAWYQYFDGGRQWYTALGHDPKSYEDPQFLKHILGGILWAIADNELDYSKATANEIYLIE